MTSWFQPKKTPKELAKEAKRDTKKEVRVSALCMACRRSSSVGCVFTPSPAQIIIEPLSFAGSRPCGVILSHGPPLLSPFFFLSFLSIRASPSTDPPSCDRFPASVPFRYQTLSTRLGSTILTIDKRLVLLLLDFWTPPPPRPPCPAVISKRDGPGNAGAGPAREAGHS